MSKNEIEPLSVEAAERHVWSVFYYNGAKFYPGESEMSRRAQVFGRLRKDVIHAVNAVGYETIRDGLKDPEVWVRFRQAYMGAAVEKPKKRKKESQKGLQLT